MNKNCYKLGSNRSIIRELFEYSKLQKAKLGEDKVFDFSLGNPSVATHEDVNKTIIDLLTNEDPTLIHGYTSAQGDNETREAIVNDLNKRFNTNYSKDMVYITCGAAASLTITFKSIVESENDEILAVAPYFTEYRVFVENSNAKFKVVEADLDSFEINFDSLNSLINKNTKAIIINSPNNPSGVVYSKESLIKLSSLLKDKEIEYDHPIYIVADEPYREIVFDNKEVSHIPSLYDDTIICYSYSKSLSLPGERIGYILVPNNVKNSKELYLTICGAGRSLGYVCAPSLLQKVITRCASLTSNLKEYEENRDLIYNGLKNIGYTCVYPQGAFYLFVKALEDDAYPFIERAKEKNIIVVPSDNFGVKGYVRIAYCVDKKTIINSLPVFKELFDSYK